LLWRNRQTAEPAAFPRRIAATARSPEAGEAGTKQDLQATKILSRAGKILDDPPIRIRLYIPADPGDVDKTLWVQPLWARRSSHQPRLQATKFFVQNAKNQLTRA